MRPHHTTTFDQIVHLYDEERRLLDKAGETWLTDQEREYFRQIRRELSEKYWPLERAERVMAEHGSPRMISDNRPMPNGRKTRPRLPAYGIAPLPSPRPGGGD